MVTSDLEELGVYINIKITLVCSLGTVDVRVQIACLEKKKLS